MLWNKSVKSVSGSKKDGVTAIELADTLDGSTSKLDCSALFIAIGHTPNSQLFVGQIDLDENGYITPQPNSTKTKIEGVFACGDVQDHVWRQAVTAAGTGCMAAIEAERWLESRGQ